MADLKRLKELAGITSSVKVIEANVGLSGQPTTQSSSKEDPAAMLEPEPSDQHEEPVDKSKLAYDDIAKAKKHVANLEKLKGTIKTDIGKYAAKIETFIITEFGGLSNLMEIDPTHAKSIMTFFSKLHDIANSK